jgi:hypothetical protein
LGRLIHSLSPQRWLKDLKLRVGESVDYALSEDQSAQSKSAEC